MPVVRLALALLVVVLGSACGSMRAAASGDSRTPVRSVLSNGVPVTVEEQRAADVVALQLLVKAGDRDEAATELGLTHYLEHMLPTGGVVRTAERLFGRMPWPGAGDPPPRPAPEPTGKRLVIERPAQQAPAVVLRPPLKAAL